MPPGLREQLEVSEPDDALLLGASELWSALLAGGPAPGVDAYEDGAATAGGRGAPAAGGAAHSMALGSP